MLNIALFCTSSEAVTPSFAADAHRLGEWIGHNRISLIYGGVDCGLMLEVAKVAKQNGGRITGVVTSALETGGIVSSLPDRLIRTATLSERKQVMMDMADLFVVFPGGIGTLDETISVLAAAHLQEHSKPVIFFNAGGFFNPLLDLFERFYKTGYASTEYRKHYAAVSNWNGCKEFLTEKLNEK